MRIKELSYKKGPVTFKYYYRPGLYLPEKVDQIFSELIQVNKESFSNLTYGIFTPDVSPDKKKTFFENSIVCLAYLDGKVIGFFNSYVVDDATRFNHAGLIIISKNPGFFDLMDFMCRTNFLFLYLNNGFNPIRMSNITCVPYGIELFAELTKNTFPDIYQNQRVLPKTHKKYLDLIKFNYIDQYFPNPEHCKIDYKRFVLRCQAKEFGFQTDFFTLSKAYSNEYNVFSKMWIDYSKDEDLIQIGEIGMEYLFKNPVLSISFIFKHLKNKISGIF